MALALIPYVWKRLDTSFKYQFNCSYFDSQNIKKLLILGVPIGIQLFLKFLFFSLASLMVGSLGAAYKGANAILDSIISIPIGMTWGFSFAASILVKQIQSVQQEEKRSIGPYYRFPSIAIGCSSAFIARYAHFMFTVCYKGSATDYELIRSPIPLAMLVMLVDVFYTVSLGLLRGLQDTFYPFLISTLSNWLIGVPLCYVFITIMNWGIPSIWLSKVISVSILASVLFYRFLKEYKNTMKRTVNFEEEMFLPAQELVQEELNIYRQYCIPPSVQAEHFNVEILLRRKIERWVKPLNRLLQNIFTLWHNGICF